MVLSWDSGVEAKDINYKITDINGKNMASALAQNQTKIALSNFAVGTYILTVYDNKNNLVKIDETMIANDYDRQYMFKRHPDYEKTQWYDVEDGIFILI